ncbi:MAG: elongation factor P [Candidatus Magasanikbacteria bacterium]
MNYRNLRPGTQFILDGNPYEVLEYNFEKKQRRKPTVKLKIRNLRNGKTRQYTARSHEEFEEADIEELPAEFIYHHRGEYWFKDPEDPSDRFKVEEEILENIKDYLKEGLEVTLQKFKGEFINVKIPDKVDLEVTQAPPKVKGNTADGGTKKVTVETGIEIKTPLFIEKGDTIRVNTETGEYTERV